MGSFKAKSLFSAIERAGLKADKSHLCGSNQRYNVSGPVYYGSFFLQDDRAICVSTCRNGDKPDGMYDHFPQTYHDTMKSFIKWVKFDGDWGKV